MNQIDVVGEYLREVELRLSGLPLLQRRELIADLHAHIASAQERGAYSEGEIIEVLERLGSPEVVAAAAYEEAGPQPRVVRPTGATTQSTIVTWLIASSVIVLMIIIFGFIGLVAFSRGASSDAPPPAPAVQPADPADPAPFPTR